ncbi:MAG: GspH/FimT family pseudopilin [Desulfocucumaceae bacterium]
MRRPSGGFTLIELMTVVSIIAILAVFALPKYTSLNKSYTLYSAARQMGADIRYAQQLAVDGGLDTIVTVDVQSAGYSIRYTRNADSATVSLPIKTVTFEPAITASATPSFFFNSLGAPDYQRNITLQLSGGARYSVNVLSGTGRVVLNEVP